MGTPGTQPGEEMPFHCLTIIGQIEGHLVLPPRNKTTKYEHVIPQLVAIEQNPKIKGLLVVLNTVGGDIEAGLAIAEMLKTMTTPVVSLVLGGGHSIGAPIAVAADHSVISETATMTIHPIRLSGMLIGVPQTYEYLDKMQDRIIRFIVANSRIGEQRLREVMFRTGELMRDVGTVLIGREAAAIGLIDRVGNIADAMAYLRHQIEARRGAVASAPALPVPGVAPVPTVPGYPAPGYAPYAAPAMAPAVAPAVPPTVAPPATPTAAPGFAPATPPVSVPPPHPKLLSGDGPRP